MAAARTYDGPRPPSTDAHRRGIVGTVPVPRQGIVLKVAPSTVAGAGRGVPASGGAPPRRRLAGRRVSVLWVRRREVQGPPQGRRRGPPAGRIFTVQMSTVGDERAAPSNAASCFVDVVDRLSGVSGHGGVGAGFLCQMAGLRRRGGGGDGRSPASTVGDATVGSVVWLWSY